MANASTKKQNQSFPKILAKIISDCKSTHEMMGLLILARAANIPEGHAEIIAAIERFAQRLPMSGDLSQDAVDSLREQERVCQKKLEARRGMVSGVGTHELMKELNELSSFLQGYCHRLSPWDEATREKLREVHELIARVLNPNPTT